MRTRISAKAKKSAPEGDREVATVCLTEDRKVTKIKLGGEETTIAYTRPLKNGEDEQCSVKIAEEVHPDLVIKMNQFRDVVIGACCLDDTMWKHAEVISALIKYDGASILGATLGSKCDFDESWGATVSTRFLKVVNKTIDQIKLEELCEEVLECLDGKRAFEQGDLFDQPSGEGEDD